MYQEYLNCLSVRQRGKLCFSLCFDVVTYVRFQQNCIDELNLTQFGH